MLEMHEFLQLRSIKSKCKSKHVFSTQVADFSSIFAGMGFIAVNISENARTLWLLNVSSLWRFPTADLLTLSCLLSTACLEGTLCLPFCWRLFVPTQTRSTESASEIDFSLWQNVNELLNDFQLKANDANLMVFWPRFYTPILVRLLNMITHCFLR